MVATASTMLALGTPAPKFSLPDTDGNIVTIDGYADNAETKGLLVAFICNHCPYVIHLAPELAKIADDYADQGLKVAAISSNDVDNYPQDSPELMKYEKANRGYNFPYLYDEDQSVAKEYRAACTPDFFLFDGDLKLAYRGQLDESRPKNDIPVTGQDMRAAVEAILAGNSAPENQVPSIGCNIKWKPGNEPEYFG